MPAPGTKRKIGREPVVIDLLNADTRSRDERSCKILAYKKRNVRLNFNHFFLSVFIKQNKIKHRYRANGKNLHANHYLVIVNISQ